MDIMGILESIFDVPYEVGLVIDWVLGFIMIGLLYLLWRLYRRHPEWQR